MKIGFDAKRAFYNRTGLGNYSRNIFQYLNKFYPENEYFLFSPKEENSYDFEGKKNAKIILANGFIGKKIPSLWRTFFISKNIKNQQIDIYHGLSNEIPKGINSKTTKTIVTIHDLIFLRFPKLYKPADRFIYNKKFKFACQKADRIIAISEQTKQDVITFYKIKPEKIEVVYQSCDPIYYKVCSNEKKEAVRQKYNLPSEYILNVGTVEERKNILSVIKAIKFGNINLPLVVVGRKTNYQRKIDKFIDENNLKNKIIFIEDVEFLDLPAIYQMSCLFVYPSIFEGFGIPIIEAINSKVPVITSNVSSLPEAGGENSLYVEPYNIEQIAETLKKVLDNKTLKNNMITKSYTFVQKFRGENIAKNIMNVYLKVK